MVLTRVDKNTENGSVFPYFCLFVEYWSPTHANVVSPPIPLEMNFKEKMLLADITHPKFVFEARFPLIDHVQIVCSNDEVVNIYDYNYNVVAGLLNIQ